MLKNLWTLIKGASVLHWMWSLAGGAIFSAAAALGSNGLGLAPLVAVPIVIATGLGIAAALATWSEDATGTLIRGRLGRTNRERRVALIQLCRTWATPASQNLIAIVRQIDQAAEMTPLVHYAVRATEPYTLKVEQALARFSTAADGKNARKLEQAAGDFYRGYAELIFKVRDLGKATDFDFGSTGNFAKWKELDAQYLGEMNRLIHHPDYDVLNGMVAGFMWPQGGTREYWT